MIKLTASFITNSGFATGLTPTVQIVDSDDGSSSIKSMVEVSPGNYKYEWEDYNENKIYFFNYDAGSSLVINRYQSSNNNEVKVAYSVPTSRGSETSVNKLDEEKKQKKAIEDVVNETTKDIAKKTDIDNIKQMVKNISETLGTIVEKTGTLTDIILSGDITSDVEKNIKDMQKSIKSIKIPTYNESKVVDDIKKEIKAIDMESCKTDLSPVLDKLDETNKKVDELSTEIDKEYKDDAIKALTGIQGQLKSFEKEVAMIAGNIDMSEEDDDMEEENTPEEPSEDDMKEIMVELMLKDSKFISLLEKEDD